MSREYDTDTHSSMTTGTRLAMFLAVLVAVTITVGYRMSFGEIRGNILFGIIAACAVVLAYAIFGGRATRSSNPQTPLEVVQEPEDYNVMWYKGQPFDFMNNDPTAPDEVLHPAS